MARMVLPVLFASQFLPENFWFIVAAYLGGCALVVGLSFWAAVHFCDTPIWVFCGLLLGGMVSVRWSVGLMPLGAAAGALLGVLFSVVIVRTMR